MKDYPIRTTDERINGMITATDKPLEECDIDDIKSRKKKQWLEAIFKSGGSINGAHRLTGISMVSHYRWLKADPVYEAVFKKVYDRSTDILESEALRRAVDGVEEDVYSNGMLVGTKRKYSDTLLSKLLDGRRPEVYKNNGNQTNVGIFGSEGNVNIQFNIPRPPKIENTPDTPKQEPNKIKNVTNKNE